MGIIGDSTTASSGSEWESAEGFGEDFRDALVLTIDGILIGKRQIFYDLIITKVSNYFPIANFRAL